VVWDQDESRALSSSMDVRVWDVGTGRCLRVLNKHSKVIRSIVQGPERHAILSASYDRTLRLWDSETGECVRVLEGHRAGVVDAAWTADRLRIIS
jgi:WD40 repeat protein